MIRALQVLALAAVSFAVACGSGKRPEASEAPPEPAPAAPAAPAPAPPAAQEPEPSAEQLPLEDDFVPQVEEQITAANYRRELDALEKEITAEIPHQ